MRFDLITIFPEFFASILSHGVLRRAIAGGLVTVEIHDLRNFAHDRHRTVDDRPFGGGEGMVLKPEPLAEAVESLGVAGKAGRDGDREQVVLLSAQGARFTQAVARQLAGLERLVLLCGRYEGVDERVSELLCDRELSVGDYVLSGGELAAAIVVDATARLLPGVLGNEASSEYESFGLAAGPLKPKEGLNGAPGNPLEPKEGLNGPPGNPLKPTEGLNGAPGNPLKPKEGLDGAPGNPLKPKEGLHGAPGGPPLAVVEAGGLLDYPHYTRPAEFRGLAVPEVLTQGDHASIRRWRRERALEKTWRNRPDLLVGAELSGGDREFLRSLGWKDRDQGPGNRE